MNEAEELKYPLWHENVVDRWKHITWSCPAQKVHESSAHWSWFIKKTTWFLGANVLKQSLNVGLWWLKSTKWRPAGEPLPLSCLIAGSFQPGKARAQMQPEAYAGDQNHGDRHQQWWLGRALCKCSLQSGWDPSSSRKLHPTFSSFCSHTKASGDQVMLL